MFYANNEGMLRFLVCTARRNGLFFAVLAAGIALPTSACAQNQAIYTDSLQNGWQDYSWATVNHANTSPVHSGTYSYSVSSTNWQALYLHHTAQNSALYSSISYWINGGTGGQHVQIQATRNGSPQAAVQLAPLPANAWRQDTFSLTSLGLTNVTDFDGFWLQVENSGVAPTLYVDDITLVTNGTPPALVTLTAPADGSAYLAPATVNLAATVTTNGHTINNVQFYSSSTLLGQSTSPPYTYSWSNVQAGSYTLSAWVIFDSGGANAGTNISSAVGITVVTNSVFSIAVDASQNRHAISPLIYGVAFGTSNQIADLNAPLNRSGGNTETRYNWMLNAHNHANDWYYESLDDYNSGDPRATVPGSTDDEFVANSKNGGADSLMTISMIGWLAKLGPNRARLASYATTNYGPQTGTDSAYFPVAGNGISVTNDTLITWNNPNDANFLTNSAYQQAWVQHLTNRWGMSTNGGIRYYLMDNEETIWFSTHRDVHPVGTTMQEIRDKFFDYAGVVKAVDPNALVLGPEEWGWSGYFYSGYDQQNPGFKDRATNGGWDYCPWLLNQYYQRATNTGQRLLDYFTLHCYPQGGEGGDDVSQATETLRNESTRQFWDTNYVDQSWIGQQAQNNILMLIPRMRGWVNTYYPGTKIGVTEYNWGAEAYINGATAQADILGIFGRENLDLATRWTTPDPSTPTYLAMKMYRNYDGAKSTFGDTSVLDAGPDPDLLSTFAAVRSADNAMTVMVINKQLAAGAQVTLSLTNFPAGNTAQLWQLTSANVISQLANVSVAAGTLTNSVPPQSINLYVVPLLLGAASTPTPANGAAGVGVTTNLSWTAGANARGHCVYFGVSSNAVAVATTNSAEFKGALASASYSPGTLSYGTTYYWRVDETNGLFTMAGPVWSFTTLALAGAATNPNPSNNAVNVSTNLSLNWTAGANATSHQVYYGASGSAVVAATTNSPEYKGSFASASYVNGTQAPSARFYWRVDEVSGAGVTTGALWTYSTAAGPVNTLTVGGATANGTNFVIGFSSQYGQTYRVEESDSLSPPDWSTLADQLPGTGGTIQVTNSGASLLQQRYYRVVLLGP
jgi:hypothetical protein